MFIHARILNKRLKAIITKALIGEDETGFRDGRSTIDCAFGLFMSTHLWSFYVDFRCNGFLKKDENLISRLVLNLSVSRKHLVE